jgi:3-deoxy-7-phosphoheptulonate synthase
MIAPTDDLKILEEKQLLPPIAVMERYPMTPAAAELISSTRRTIEAMLRGDDGRLLVVVGPCSIHDVDAALEYAQRLAPLRESLGDALEIVMRVYFEKPRTTLGWKGLINDPYLDNSFRINDGLRMARKLLLDINGMGVPAAGEFLDAISPQYIADLMAWGAIGARTTESQNHRQFASATSCPVGFKNGTDGNIKIAIDGVQAAAASHHFLSVTKFGNAAIIKTAGNAYCHLILRGGNQPNYSPADVQQAREALAAAGLPQKLMIDCSHANSHKDFRRQPDVVDSVAAQLKDGDDAIFAVMIESHLNEGNQPVDGEELAYGVSITDACLGWDDTVAQLEKLATAQRARKL